MIPRHKDPSINRRAIAPYNFVPLPDEIRTVPQPPPFDRYDPDLLTGRLSCTLTTASPLYVRAAMTVEEYHTEKFTPSDPYYGETKEELLIPGSSLRGMLRTMVEIVSSSRLAPVTNKRLFYRTVDNTSLGYSYRSRMKDRVRAGFYHEDQRGAWIEPAVAGRVDRSRLQELFGASLYTGGRGPSRVPNPDLQHREVYVELAPDALNNPGRFYPVQALENEPAQGLHKATLVITGDMNNKLHEFVFFRLNSGVRLNVSDELVDLLEDDDQLTQYQKNAFKKGEDRRKDGGLKSGEPVFYLVDDAGQVEAFGRAYMFRLPYRHAPEEMLPASLNASDDQYDMAESMFGTVISGEARRDNLAGRIFVSNAVLKGKASEALLSDEPITLRVLSSPKPTTFQHYLTQPSPDDQRKLTHYDDSPDADDAKHATTLRGHKLYWHKGDVNRADFEATAQDVSDHPTQYAPPVKPVRSGQTFTFDIHFENLRPEELGALLWVLDKAASSKYRLKIGMGKPYGLGSVAISYEAQLTDRKQRYTSLFKDNGWNEGWMQEAEVNARMDEARLRFARWLLKDASATPDQVDALPRIRHFLALLTWEGRPDPATTRYMELDEFTGRKGILPGSEGTKRPVLPYPTTVLHGTWEKDAPAAPGSAPEKQPSAPRVRQPKPEKPQPVEKPPAELKPGDIIRATVDDAPAVGDIILIPRISGEEDLAIIRAANRGLRGYRVNEEILLEVLELSGDEENGWVIDCQPVKP